MTYNLEQNIRQLITNHKLNQDDFGESVGSSGRTISNWVNGVAIPPLDKLILISEKYAISLDVLILGKVGQSVDQYTKWRNENTNVKVNEPKLSWGEVNKDQLISMLQEKVTLLENTLPDTLKVLFEESFSKIDDIHDAFTKVTLENTMKKTAKNLKFKTN